MRDDREAVRQGLTTLLVDPCDGEPTRHARRGARQVQPAEAAGSLGVTRRTLDSRSD